MELYTQEKQLGRGAMGSVYLVRRNADGLRLALKTVASERAREEKRGRRFSRRTHKTEQTR